MIAHGFVVDLHVVHVHCCRLLTKMLLDGSSVHCVVPPHLRIELVEESLVVERLLEP
jgi:hypothetical protein